MGRRFWRINSNLFFGIPFEPSHNFLAENLFLLAPSRCERRFKRYARNEIAIDFPKTGKSFRWLGHFRRAFLLARGRHLCSVPRCAPLL